MFEPNRWIAPVLSVIAATGIALACGTNYAYSAWAPSFADRMKLSSTQQNLIGTFGNLGMYTAGIPVGILVDSGARRLSVLIGSVCMGVGYFLYYKTYQWGPGSVSVPWLCFFGLLTGIGSCASFSGALKTAALNFPTRRGTATAFPLSGLGLSAFFLSIISSFAFPDNTSDLLLLFTILTFAMPFIGNFFLPVVPQSHKYTQISGTEDRRESETSTKLQRTKSEERKYAAGLRSDDPGTRPVSDDQIEETSSLLSKSSDGPGDVRKSIEEDAKTMAQENSHRSDIRGISMLKHLKFYQLWAIFGVLTGVGLMTINNIGNDTRDLWHRWDDSVTGQFVQKQQLIQVELLSFMSFIGRLLSGIGSDVLVHQFFLSRFWCLVISATFFILAQFGATVIWMPHLLGFVSALTGLGYGFIFGCYPALIAETFGVNGMTQNWGFMTLATGPSAHLFNLIYGRTHDFHSIIKKDGSRECQEGINCYRTAYIVTLAAAVVGLLMSLGSVRYDWVKRRGRGRGKDREASQI